MADNDEQVRSSAFPVTHWSLVRRAGSAGDGGPGAADDPAAREALHQLVVRYLPALKAHLVYTRRLPPDEADDLLQSFVAAKVLEQNLFRRADRGQGKFRTFLLSAPGNFLVDAVRARNAKKRSAGRDAVPIDEQRDEVVDPREEPSAAFDAAWARQVIDRAVDLARQACDADGRADVWGVFQARVLDPALHGAEPVAYDVLVRQFGLASPDQASNVLVTGKRIFTRALRQAVGEYAQDGDVEQELQELKAILARAPR